MTQRLWILGLMTMLLVAACGGDDNGGNGGDAGNNAQQNNAQQAAPRNYSVTFTGDYEGTIPPGSAQVVLNPERDTGGFTFPASLEIFFGQLSHFIQIDVPADTGPGEYQLSAPDILGSGGGYEVDVSIALDPDNVSAGFDDYNNETTGTLTLDSVGDTVSGSFEFTAVAIDDEGGRKTINVTGIFEDVRVLVADE